MQRIGPFLRRYGFDLALVGVVLLGLFEVTRDGASEEQIVSPAVGALAVVVLVLPLFARRRFPFGAPASVWVLGSALSFAEGQLAVTTFSVYLSGLIAAYLLGDLTDPILARLGLVIVLIGAGVVVFNDSTRAPSDFVTIPATFAIAWLAGFVFRSRADRLEEAESRAIAAERERESAARVAVAEERSRITRELHDVVAHAVSVMVLQVGAVRHRLPDSLREDKEALRAVEGTGRSALTEMRRLLGVIHDDGREPDLAPQPGLDRIDALIAEVGAAGLPVHLHYQGEPFPLPRAIDLSAYRIVQEALTNSLKHSGASRADVTLRYEATDLHITVDDDGIGPTAGDGLGHGITGIRERVKIYGGEITLGKGPGGGFRVGIRLPIGSSRP